MAGKGDTPRPVDQKKFAKNWDRIFNKKKDKDDQSAKSGN